ncbi:FAD-binding oxidoreductase [Nonomuraea aridisoli]|uniref:FAD-binding oxidoreductase n=1 Tax=Nonomuraea aridisoli TaxID=2070368 RepID=A0A2W2EWU3_9ACTN|nr:FAD-binding oxidoreductase [Nonomuraea aridisoli]PZG13857.1 FAD-binding oxidoreductase [Nonomuraea aridisoli]
MQSGDFGERLITVAGLLRVQLPPEMVVTEPSAIAALIRLWNAQVMARPSVVARCRTTADVQAAVRAARSAGMPLSVLGGGHDWSGSAVRDGGLLVDISTMRQVTVEGAEARVAGGATVSDVLDAARPHGHAAAVGTVSSVGFAGLTLGGGYGTLIGVAGLGVDNLLSAEVVLADGRVVTADPQHEPDLFWALRGGGGNFGVVTELRTRLHPFATVTSGTIAFGWDQARSVLLGWRKVMASADDALDVMFGAMHTPAGLVLYTTPAWAGDPGDAARQIAQIRALGAPVLDDVDRRALADTVHALDDMFPHGGNYHLGSQIVPPLTDDVIDAFVRSAEAMPATCVLNVHHSHGAATRVPVTETAYAYRDEHLVVEIIGAWFDGDGAAESAWVQDAERRLGRHALPGGWANLLARGDQRARNAYGINTSRLLAVKSHYDPDGVFTAIPLPD